MPDASAVPAEDILERTLILWGPENNRWAPCITEMADELGTGHLPDEIVGRSTPKKLKAGHGTNRK